MVSTDDGVMVMTVLPSLMVAENETLAPLLLVSLRVRIDARSEFPNTLPSVLRTASLKVMVMVVLIATPVAPLAGLKVTVGAVLSPGSEKSMTRSLRLAPLGTAPSVKSVVRNVMVRLLMSLALACEVAVPVKDKVATVLLEPTVNTAVKPAGTLVTRAARFVPSAAEKVSLLKVMVMVAVMEPLLAPASASVVAL